MPTPSRFRGADIRSQGNATAVRTRISAIPEVLGFTTEEGVQFAELLGYGVDESFPSATLDNVHFQIGLISFQLRQSHAHPRNFKLQVPVLPPHRLVV